MRALGMLDGDSSKPQRASKMERCAEVANDLSGP